MGVIKRLASKKSKSTRVFKDTSLMPLFEALLRHPAGMLPEGRSKICSRAFYIPFAAEIPEDATKTRQKGSIELKIQF